MTRQRLAPEIRRRQVLDAAVAVFSEHGFHGASMDDVAARAGVSKPMVYAHGGTKDGLFAACVRREADRLLRSVQAAAGGAPDDPQSRLWLGLRAFFHALTTRREGWTVLYRQASTGPFAAEVADGRSRIIERTAALLAEGIGARPADVAPFAHTLVGAAEGMADWWLTTNDPRSCAGAADAEPGDTLARMLMTVIGPGLDALRSGRMWEPSIGPYAPVSPTD